MKMTKSLKLLSCIAAVFAFCFISIGYAAVQDELLINGNMSVDGYYLKDDFNFEDTEGYSLSADGTLIIEELYYDPYEGKSFLVVGIEAGGFKNNEDILTLVLPDSVTYIGENAFSGCIYLSEVSFGEDFTEIRASSFDNTALTEDFMLIPDNSLVVCNQLGADISKYVTNSTSYTIELASAYGADRPVVTAYTGDAAEIYGYASVAESKFELKNNGKLVDLLPTTQYAYVTLDADNGLHIKNRYGYVPSDNTFLLEADGIYELGDNGDVYALPTINDVSIVVLENSIVPLTARTDGWDTLRHTGNIEFESHITSVVFADAVALKGDLKNLFYHFGALQTADLRKADFSQVTSLYEFFDGCSSLTNVWFNENGSTDNVVSMSKMFSLCTSLTSEDMDKSLSGLSTESVTNMSQMFIGCEGLTELTIPNWDFSNVTSMNSMFAGCTGLTKVTFDGDLVSESLTDMGYMFGHRNNMSVWNCGKLETVTFKGKIDTPNLDSMSSMFVHCKSLKSVTFGGDVLTPKLTNMSSLFQWCENLTTVTFTGTFDTSSVTNMGNMFNNCKSLTTVDLSKFDTPNLKYMNSMFSYSAITNVDFSTFTFDNIESTAYMFEACGRLTSVTWNPTGTPHLVNVAGMFKSCGNLSSLDMSGFTGTLTTMNYMFDGCKKLSGALDLSGFDTHSVTAMDRLFWDCQNIKTIYVSKKFVVSDGTSTGAMFAQCGSLKGGHGTTVASMGGSTNGTYARIDNPPDSPGYFTLKTEN